MIRWKKVRKYSRQIGYVGDKISSDWVRGFLFALAINKKITAKEAEVIFDAVKRDKGGE